MGARGTGHGVLRYADGSVYTGPWERNVRVGKGIFASTNGLQYVGDWVNASAARGARRLFADARMRQGMRHGMGVLTHINGIAGETNPLADLTYNSFALAFNSGQPPARMV